MYYYFSSLVDVAVFILYCDLLHANELQERESQLHPSSVKNPRIKPEMTHETASLPLGGSTSNSKHNTDMEYYGVS